MTTEDKIQGHKDDCKILACGHCTCKWGGFDVSYAVAQERERCLEIVRQYAVYIRESPAPEHGGFKDPGKMVEMAEKIEKDIRAGS